MRRSDAQPDKTDHLCQNMDEYGEQHEPEVTEAPPSGPKWNSALRCQDSLGSRQALQQEAP